MNASIIKKMMFKRNKLMKEYISRKKLNRFMKRFTKKY